MEILQKIATEASSEDGTPKKIVRIADCGQIKN
jgi:hypothetical protein